MKYSINGSYQDANNEFKRWYVDESEIECTITSSHFFLSWIPKDDPFVNLRVGLTEDFATAFKLLVAKIEAYYHIKYEAPARRLAHGNYIKESENGKT